MSDKIPLHLTQAVEVWIAVQVLLEKVDFSGSNLNSNSLLLRENKGMFFSCPAPLSCAACERAVPLWTW